MQTALFESDLPLRPVEILDVRRAEEEGVKIRSFNQSQNLVCMVPMTFLLMHGHYNNVYDPSQFKILLVTRCVKALDLVTNLIGVGYTDPKSNCKFSLSFYGSRIVFLGIIQIFFGLSTQNSGLAPP